ncbi:MAG TPA: endonuclease/exonuclease/phosphatase family protein [Roseiflexaceae bacterium]|nr:endonuclease/exonuclease/phosphatase family protein [Roseiflexaceae bacterium]
MNRVSSLLRRAAHHTLSLVATAYGGVLLLLSLLWAIAAERHWLIAVTNIFAPLLFIPLLLLIPAALLLRSRPLRGATVLALLIALAAVGPYLTPTFAAPPAGRPLRIATFNLWQSNPDLVATLLAARDQDADIIAFQELTHDAAAIIRAQLSDMYPYQHLTPTSSHAGLGVISRYPIVAQPAGFRAPGQQLLIDVDGQPLTFVNVHLAAPRYLQRSYATAWYVPPLAAYSSATRDTQMDRFLTAIESIHGPLVVAGDFNTSDREPRYQQLATTLHDAYRATSWGFGFTFPNNKVMLGVPIPFPLVRIDYVWTRDAIAPVDTRIVCDHTSDHCMLVADLVLFAPYNEVQND